MMGPTTIFCGYGSSVAVAVPVGLSLGDLTRYVAPEITHEGTDDRRVDILLNRWNGVFHLVVGEHRYGPYREMHNVYRAFANGIHFLLGQRSPMTFIHAGAIEIDGKAVIFPARSRWGKSTLVADLVEQGCGYLSDEYAVVSPEGAVFPLSKPIRLRTSSGGARYLSPPGVRAPGGLACAAVILTKYEAGSCWNPEPLTPGSAIMAIVSSVLKSREEPEQILEALTALVRDAQCYQTSRGDNKPTVAEIRDLRIVHADLGHRLVDANQEARA